MRTIMAGLAEFEIMPGSGSSQGRQTRPPAGSTPSNKKTKRVLGMHADGLSYRLIARNVGWARPR